VPARGKLDGIGEFPGSAQPCSDQQMTFCARRREFANQGQVSRCTQTGSSALSVQIKSKSLLLSITCTT
jgi:hypothetical protein